MKLLIRLCMLCLLASVLEAETIHPRIISLDANQARIYVLGNSVMQLSMTYRARGTTHAEYIHSSGKHQHLFVLHDLQAAQSYEYTISSHDLVVAQGQFTTPATQQQQISLCVFGQAAQPHITQTLQQQLVRALQAEKADYYIYGGALFNDIADDVVAEDWHTQLYKPYAALMAQHKTSFVCSVHAQDKKMGLQAVRMHLPEIDHRYMEVIQRGPLVCLTMSPSQNSFRVFIRDLEQALKKTSFARWRCLCMYPCVPMRSHSLWSNAEQEQFYDLIMRYRVDVVISASEQQYLRYKPFKNEHHACLFLNTALGMQSPRRNDKRLAAMQERDPHYLVLHITDNSLEVICKGVDQRIFDRFYMNRDRYQAYLQTAIPSAVWRTGF